MADLDPIVANAKQQLEQAMVGPDGLVASDSVFDIRVSLKLVGEACALLSGLLAKLSESGLAIRHEEGTTEILVDDVTVPIQIREEVTRLPTEVRAPTESEWRHKQFRLEPCGELSLTIFGPAGRRYTWAGSSRRISSELDELVLRALSVAALRRRLRETSDPGRDSDKIRELEATVGQWRRAERIREFIAAARSSTRTDSEWLEWAAAYADSIDPLHGDR